MPQEGFLHPQRSITDLGRCFASTLALLTVGATLTERRDGTRKRGQSSGVDQVGEAFFEQVPQNGIGVIAWAEVTQRVKGVVGALAARRAEAETQVGKKARIDETRL